MSALIYDTTRRRFAVAQINWETDAVGCVIPAKTYVANFISDASISVVGTPRSVLVNVTNKIVNPAGWWQCDSIFIPVSPIDETVDNVVLYRLTDGLLLLQITFIPFISPTGKPFLIVPAMNAPGYCRL